MTAWQEYLRWNSAICTSVFPEDPNGRPVYLDMDESVLELIAGSLGVEPEEARASFLAVVRATVDLSAPREEVFSAHVRQLTAWRRRVQGVRGTSALEPPPTIALLAAFTVAAETMGSDSTVAVHAYYPRLAAVFGATGERQKERLTAAYQGTAEQLWRSLNDWLALADGRYGTPTAYALAHRYVGLPLSQALIREADRRHLLQMFRQFGLPPGSVMTPGDMGRIIDTWMSQNPCPASMSLQRLWQRGAARERIAEVATAELAAWDSTLTDETVPGTAPRAGSIQLLCQLRRFPRASMQLSFIASMPGASDLEQVRVVSAEGEPTLDVLALGGGQFRPRSSADLDSASLAEGVLRLVDTEGQSEAKRYPRRVVPLRKDESSNAYVECERVQLGEDFHVLVKNDRGLVDEVLGLLAKAARPGFETKTSLAGLPHGWTLVTDVQMLASPSSTSAQHPDLNALVPLVNSHLSVAGGLKLPGSLRKWSSIRPPEIRAVSQTSTDLRLSMARTDIASGDDDHEQTWTSDNGVILADLAEEDLADGDYELRLTSGGEALQRFMVRLRSSDTPDSWTWSSAPALRDDVRAPWAAVSATLVEDVPATDDRATMAAPRLTRDNEARPGLPTIWWKHPQTQARQIVPIVIAAPEPDSCVVTLKHYMLIPATTPGRPTAPFTIGECKKCGLMKRYPTRPKRSKKPQWTDHSEVELDRAREVADVKDETLGPDDALDALVHVGGGSPSSLERVLAQIDSSALEIDSMRRSLESLGHIELRRDPHQDIVGWRMAPPRLLETADDTFFLAGAWSRRAIAELQEAVEEAGGTFSYFDEQANGLTTWFVEDLRASAIEDLLSDLSEWLPMGCKAVVERGAAARLVEALPPLSSIAATLPRVALPGAQRISRFDLETASWVPVQTAVTPGAYRMESGFRSRYIFRSDADVDQHEAVICSPQLAKHLEANRTGRPLLAYFPAPRQLAVPRGADLPVLYGRAAVLNSGMLPVGAKKEPALIYRRIPQQVAHTLHILLSN